MRHRCPTPLVVLAITLAVLGLSAFAFFWFIPTVIIRAYHGESLAALNALIRGQAAHPVEEYLSEWRLIARSILIGEMLLGFVFAVLTWPTFQRRVDAWVGPVPVRRTLIGGGMPKGREVVVSCVMLFVVGMQLLDIGLQKKHWPFSNQAMYSGQQLGSMWWIRVYGVTPEGEFWLVPEKYLLPFDTIRLVYGFESQVLSRSDWRTAVDQALRNLHELYKMGRRSGSHGGPPLLALRLYRFEWRLDPSLANKENPEKKEQLYELRLAN
jgi:hypothetical protein